MFIEIHLNMYLPRIYKVKLFVKQAAIFVASYTDEHNSIMNYVGRLYNMVSVVNN